MATPAIANGVIFIRGLKDVFAIGPHAVTTKARKHEEEINYSSS